MTTSLATTNDDIIIVRRLQSMWPLIRLEMWHCHVILAVVVVGDGCAWLWPLVMVASWCCGRWWWVRRSDCLLMTPKSSISIIIPFRRIPLAFLPSDSWNHSGRIWILFEIPLESLYQFGRPLCQIWFLRNSGNCPDSGRNQWRTIKTSTKCVLVIFANNQMCQQNTWLVEMLRTKCQAEGIQGGAGITNVWLAGGYWRGEVYLVPACLPTSM